VYSPQDANPTSRKGHSRLSGAIIVDAPTALSVDLTDSHHDVQPDAATPAESTTSSPEPITDPQPAAELNRLMVLADRYVRKLVSTADAPSDALMIVQHGDLDILAFDGVPHIQAAVRRLLAQRQPSSAVLIVDACNPGNEPSENALHIIGETADGLRDAWHYRVRGCGTRRRLTRQIGPAIPLTPEALSYPLFARVTLD